MVNRLLCGLGAGFIGALANVLAVWGINAGLGTFQFDKNFLYRQIFWGGLWGLAYCCELLEQNWIARGAIVGVLASLVTLFVFKALPLTGFNLLRVFIVNVIAWGGVSSYVYWRAQAY